MKLNKIISSLFISLGIILLLTINTSAKELKHIQLSKKLRDSLNNQIEAMLVDDQKFRWMLAFGEMDDQKIKMFKDMDDSAKFLRMKEVKNHKVGINIAQIDSLKKLQETIDSANFFKIKAIINTYGFPHKGISSYKITTILYHSADGLLDDDFFKMLREEIAIGNLKAIEYARLFDRVQSERRLPELYFVNYHYDFKAKKAAIGTPVDIDKTNKAREEIGLKKYHP